MSRSSPRRAARAAIGVGGTRPDDDRMGELAERRRTGRVLISSNRAAAGVYADDVGPILVERLNEWGYLTPEATIAADGDPFGAQLRQALSESPDVVLTRGAPARRRRMSLPNRPHRYWIGSCLAWPRQSVISVRDKASPPRSCRAGWPESRAPAWS